MDPYLIFGIAIAAFIIGMVTGIALSMLMARTSHRLDFDWRLTIRRSRDDG